MVNLGQLQHTQSPAECIQFVFPSDILPQPETCICRAILSPFNQYVDRFNTEILGSLPGEAITYFSSDQIEEDGEEITDHPAGTQDLLLWIYIYSPHLLYLLPKVSTTPNLRYRNYLYLYLPFSFYFL